MRWVSVNAAFLLLGLAISVCEAITCYECSSTNGQDCRMSSSTCSYGFFGCIKIATYSGGVDKFGNFYNDESRIITMNRGCTILPLGGVDACQQQSIVGYRIVTCYCFTDFCNDTPSVRQKHEAIVLISIFYVIFSFSF